MANPLDIENLRAVFVRIMQTHQLKPQDVKKERKGVSISDKGLFECEECPHMWESNFSWITFDLKEMEITYRWKMKCKSCLTACHPTFTVEQIEAMYERAVCWYKGERTPSDVNIGHGARRDRRPPHLNTLCEKCQWGQEMCWLRRYC